MCLLGSINATEGQPEEKPDSHPESIADEIINQKLDLTPAIGIEPVNKDILAVTIDRTLLAHALTTDDKVLKSLIAINLLKENSYIDRNDKVIYSAIHFDNLKPATDEQISHDSRFIKLRNWFEKLNKTKKNNAL